MARRIKITFRDDVRHSEISSIRILDEDQEGMPEKRCDSCGYKTTDLRQGVGSQKDKAFCAVCRKDQVVEPKSPKETLALDTIDAMVDQVQVILSFAENMLKEGVFSDADCEGIVRHAKRLSSMITRKKVEGS